MKTTKRTSRTLPSPIRFSIYVIAVAAFCFVNWTALRAADSADNEACSLEAQMVTVAEDTETELTVEDWMVDTSSWINTDILATK